MCSYCMHLDAVKSATYQHSYFTGQIPSCCLTNSVKALCENLFIDTSLKVVNDAEVERRAGGRLFHTHGPATANARSPMDARRVDGTTRSEVDAERMLICKVNDDCLSGSTGIAAV